MTDKTAFEGQALKPCPFCGGEGAFGEVKYCTSHEAWWPDGSQVLHAHFVSCVKCGGNRRSIVGGHQTKAEAVAAWNARFPALEAERDALREALAEIASSAFGNGSLSRDRDAHTLSMIEKHARRALAISEKSE